MRTLLRGILVLVVSPCVPGLGQEPPPPPTPGRLDVATGDEALGLVETSPGGGTCSQVATAPKGEPDERKKYYRIRYAAPRRTNPAWLVRLESPLDVSDFKSIRVLLWSGRGTRVHVGLKDSNSGDRDAPDVVRLPQLGTRVWHKVAIPLGQFESTDLRSVTSVSLQFEGGTSGTVFMDSLAFDTKPIRELKIEPPPPPPVPLRITYPTNRDRVSRVIDISGESNLTPGSEVVPYVIPDGDGIAYRQPAGVVGDDWQWTAYSSRFGRIGPVDIGEWFTLYVVARGPYGRSIRSPTIRVQRR